MPDSGREGLGFQIPWKTPFPSGREGPEPKKEEQMWGGGILKRQGGAHLTFHIQKSSASGWGVSPEEVLLLITNKL